MKIAVIDFHQQVVDILDVDDDIKMNSFVEFLESQGYDRDCISYIENDNLQCRKFKIIKNGDINVKIPDYTV